MGRLSTCKNCNKKLQSEERYIHNSKTYCKECYQKNLRDSEEYKKLIEFICTYYEIKQPTGFMLKQIKDMKTEFNWTYSAMTYTLWYCKEILGKQLVEKYGVALIKHFYEEASNYYSQQEKIKEQIKQLNDVEVKTRIVKKHQNTPNKTNSLLINLDNLLKGDEIY